MKRKYQRPTINVFRIENTPLLINLSQGEATINNYKKVELEPKEDGDDYSGYDE
ncbi:hypothetical protein [Prevotella melaninogenica]|uniref:hypothetical protein n=1 Tax=Prevotella melaninogenica TaxID=28132 RepID=UPI000ADA73A7|nr:hypothetical protein [Prevotella melaninogenica]